ncbi:MAG: hypothetical protein ACFE9L_12500 [Candidatus Hodarchaeota archaeon]
MAIDSLLGNKKSTTGMIIGVISGIVIVFSLIKSLDQGNLESLIQWLLTHITVITITIEFPFGVTLFVIITAGGITASVKFRET